MLTRKFVCGLFEAFAVVGCAQTVLWLIILCFNFSWLGLIGYIGQLSVILFIAKRRTDN